MTEEELYEAAGDLLFVHLLKKTLVKTTQQSQDDVGLFSTIRGVLPDGSAIELTLENQAASIVRAAFDSDTAHDGTAWRNNRNRLTSAKNVGSRRGNV